MRKCEKDFNGQVFSFLSCLIDALPLSNLNFRKGKGLLTSRIIEDKRQSCLASCESLGFAMIVRSCFLKYMIDRNCNKLGCIGFSVATTNYIKSYGKQSAVPTMSQVLKSFKQGWVKRVARINPSATK